MKPSSSGKKKKHGNEILYIVVNWLKIRFQSSKLKWGEVRLDSTFFMAHLIEKLCFTLIGFLFDNAYMHSVYKSTFFFSYYKATQGCSKMNLSCFFHLGSWCRTLAFYMHFKIWICYSTVWHFERSQPLLVCLISWMSVFLCWRLFFFFFWGADVRGSSLAGSILHLQSIRRRPLWCVLTAVPFLIS